MMFGLLATKPEYSQIIKPFIALSPVPFMGNATSPLIRGKPLIPLMRSLNDFSQLNLNLEKYYLRFTNISDHIRILFFIWGNFNNFIHNFAITIIFRIFVTKFYTFSWDLTESNLIL
jgi:hypothetical protein